MSKPWSENRKHNMMFLYGITEDEWKALLHEQDGRCKICKTDLLTWPFSKIHTDHDHATGAIRGILCRNCNNGLGLFKDDIWILDAAIQYLKASKLKSSENV